MCHQDLFLLKNWKAEFPLWSLQCLSSSLFFSLRKRSKWKVWFWQVNHTHAAFGFGPLARPNEKLITFCTCLLHPAVWPLSRMSVWTTFRCLHSSSWNSHSWSSPNASGYLITVKPCDVKPSFNSVNLKPQKWQNLLESLIFVSEGNKKPFSEPLCISKAQTRSCGLATVFSGHRLRPSSNHCQLKCN